MIKRRILRLFDPNKSQNNPNWVQDLIPELVTYFPHPLKRK